MMALNGQIVFGVAPLRTRDQERQVAVELRESGQQQAVGSDGSRAVVTKQRDQGHGGPHYFLPDGTELFFVFGAWTHPHTRVRYWWQGSETP
jgi:hypothetical protein